jgi:formate hydrogenlyase subunit 4
MEAIKYVAMYGLEITVVVLVGVTLIAGLYQLIRDKVRARTESRTTAPVHESVKRS